jgi:hypothetical protein
LTSEDTGAYGLDIGTNLTTLLRSVLVSNRLVCFHGAYFHHFSLGYSSQICDAQTGDGKSALYDGSTRRLEPPTNVCYDTCACAIGFKPRVGDDEA